MPLLKQHKQLIFGTEFSWQPGSLHFPEVKQYFNDYLVVIVEADSLGHPGVNVSAHD